MKKICILDSAFSLEKQKSAGVSARCVKWQIKKKGIEVVESIPSADYVFVTSTHPINAEYSKKIKKYGKPVFVGGAGALSPRKYLDYSDYVVLGDGGNVIEAIAGGDDFEKESNLLLKGKVSVDINQSFPFDCPPIQQEDGSWCFFLGRGCKNKCYFCQTTWAIKYQESTESPYLMASRYSASGKKISYLSNDPSQHSFFKKLPKNGHGSYSIRFMKQNGLPQSRLIRIGVEGVSSRLRTLVNKPIPTDDLLKCTAWLNQNGKGVRWFMIAGLPTETDMDWEELRENILWWKSMVHKGVLELSFTAWCPEPSTPLSIFPIDDSYYDRFNSFKEWFFSGMGFSNRIKLYSPQKPENRLTKAMASMAANREAIYSGGLFGGNDIVNYPYKKQTVKIADKLYNEKEKRATL